MRAFTSHSSSCRHSVLGLRQSQRVCSGSASSCRSKACGTAAARRSGAVAATPTQEEQSPTAAAGPVAPAQLRITSAVALAAALMAGGGIAAPPASLAAAEGGNSAVLSDLKRLQRQQRVLGEGAAADPKRALADRFGAARAQLGRVELLARVGEFQNARLQLREGAFSKLRLDLAYGQEMYRLVPEAAARELVESVERLDGALKRRAAPEELKPIVERMSAQLRDVAEAAARMREIS